MCNSATSISNLEWILIEDNIKVAFNSWSKYYDRLIYTNKDLACQLVPLHVKFKILQFIFSLDRSQRHVETINILLEYLINWVAGKIDNDRK